MHSRTVLQLHCVIGVKLIGEEEFDFDIPEEYLNISYEPIHPDSLEENHSTGTTAETAEDPIAFKSEDDPNNQIEDRDESFHLLPLMTVPAPEQDKDIACMSHKS